MRMISGFVAVLVAVGPALGDEPVKSKAPISIAAAEAKDHVGQAVTVAFTVKHAKDGTHRMTYYLDSEADYKGPNNLALLISYKDAEAFKKAGINDIVKHFDGKAIKVTGTVVHDDNQTCIHLTAPDQIALIKAKMP